VQTLTPEELQTQLGRGVYGRSLSGGGGGGGFQKSARARRQPGEACLEFDEHLFKNVYTHIPSLVIGAVMTQRERQAALLSRRLLSTAVDQRALIQKHENAKQVQREVAAVLSLP